jgi:hypothetical protein
MERLEENVDFRRRRRDNRWTGQTGTTVTRALCLTLVVLQFVMPILAHDHGSGTHLHADRLLPSHHEDTDDPDHDHDAVYLPVAVSLVGLRDAGPDAPLPIDVAFASALNVASDAPQLSPAPPLHPHRPPPERPLFLSLCSLRC